VNTTWLLAQSEPSAFMQWVDKLARTPLSQVIYFALAITVLRAGVFWVLTSTPPHKRGGLYTACSIVNDLGDALVYSAILVFLLVRPFGIQTFWIPSGSMIDTLLERDMIVANKMVYRMGSPQRGDIVVFEPPPTAPNAQEGDVDYIKRLIGLPGEVIEIKDRQLFVNGKKLDEPYVEFTTLASGFREVIKGDGRNKALYPPFRLVQDGERLVPIMISDDGLANFGRYDSDQGSTDYPGAFPAVDEEEGKKWAELPAAKIPPDHYLFMGDNRNGSSDGRFWGLVKRDKIVGKFEFVWLPFNRIGAHR
jgi:signal peptidase I